LNFYNVDSGIVLSIYAAYAKRTILRPFVPPPALVRLKTACPVSREEALYAMTTVLALNGVALVEDGEKFVQAVVMPQRSMVTTHAPKADPTAENFCRNRSNRSPTSSSSN